MGIIKRSNSKFWYIQFQFNGQTYIKSTKTTDKKLAEFQETELRRKVAEESIFGIKEQIEIPLAFEQYCNSKRELASHSNIVRNAKLIASFLKEKKFVSDIKSSDVERLRHSQSLKGYSNQTIKHQLGVISGMIKFMSRMGYQIPQIEYPRISLPKGKLRYLSFEEEKQLLTANNPKRSIKGLAPYGKRNPKTQREMDDLYDFLVLLIDTGARYSELSNLTWSQVNLSEKTINLWRSKVKNESIPYMTERVFLILFNRKVNSEKYVFQNSKGTARNYIPTTLRKAFNRAGLIDCTPHTLRHTFATRLIQSGLNLYEIKELLGHSDIRTTMRYAHLEQKNISLKAAEIIDKLNA